MTYKLQSHIKPPKESRTRDMPTPSELKAFRAYISAYRATHSCNLSLGYFDPESRLQVFEGPAMVQCHSARRCKELIRQLNFRKA